MYFRLYSTGPGAIVVEPGFAIAAPSIYRLKYVPMGAATSAVVNAPESPRPATLPPEYLIAHHTPDRYSRTIVVRVRRRPYHLCARCSGQVVGFALYLAVFFVVPGGASFLLVPAALLSVALFPIPAAVDWITQALGRRESTNGLRFASGGLLGAAFAGLLALLITERWELLLGGLLLLATYLAALLVVLRVTGGWHRVLREHFPDAIPP